jgi:hypothetical protein
VNLLPALTGLGSSGEAGLYEDLQKLNYRHFAKRKANEMRFMGKAGLFVFALVAVALGQSRLQTDTPPAAAATGPGFAVSAGYTYLAMPIPSAGQVNLSGLDVSGQLDLRGRWGATVDSNYVRSSQVFSTGHDSYILSALAGPVFYPVERGRTRMFVLALAGAGLVDSAVPVSGTHYLHGWIARPSEAVGGGFEHSISQRFAVRVGGDYLRTTFVDSTMTAHPQNNFRATVSFVCRLKERRGILVP